MRERAILALLSERTIARAARRCGVNEKTLRRWIANDEEFKRALAEARHALSNRIHEVYLPALAVAAMWK